MQTGSSFGAAGSENPDICWVNRFYKLSKPLCSSLSPPFWVTKPALTSHHIPQGNQSPTSIVWLRSRHQPPRHRRFFHQRVSIDRLLPLLHRQLHPSSRGDPVLSNIFTGLSNIYNLHIKVCLQVLRSICGGIKFFFVRAKLDKVTESVQFKTNLRAAG